ncbi:ATP-binding protein [Oscillatoria amoena NRMC-F 0135]|nr:ATP-binding protein [Geitlerinema splendidum]MDL5051183.1 ATP-binding protein [Oscillatoria amoena NRMC-F 0135]
MAIRVLITEDEILIARKIEQTLKRAGYEVVGIATDGEAALQKVSETAPNLVLMDIVMPGELDGVETAQIIRDRFRVPVVYLTAYADRETLERAKITLPFGYVLKPFEERELTIAVEIALSRHQIECELQAMLDKSKGLSQQNETSQTLKSEYISYISHEFRNPLAAIASSAELLQAYHNHLNEDKRQKHFERINSAVSAINQLLEDIVILESSESSAVLLAPRPLNIVEFCQDLIDSLQFSIGQSHILQFTHQSTCETLVLDEKMLWQILTNLLTNAIKYSPIGATIELDIICEMHQLTCQIRDRGMGIPPECQTRLFEPFYRAANAKQRPGTGLGLTIVKRAVDLLKGEISINSTIGVGTTVCVTLPLIADPPPSV